jgi:hypothetical protein
MGAGFGGGVEVDWGEVGGGICLGRGEFAVFEEVGAGLLVSLLLALEAGFVARHRFVELVGEALADGLEGVFVFLLRFGFGFEEGLGGDEAVGGVEDGVLDEGFGGDVAGGIGVTVGVAAGVEAGEGVGGGLRMGLGRGREPGLRVERLEYGDRSLAGAGGGGGLRGFEPGEPGLGGFEFAAKAGDVLAFGLARGAGGGGCELGAWHGWLLGQGAEGDLKAVEEKAGAAGVDVVVGDGVHDLGDGGADGVAVFGDGEVVDSGACGAGFGVGDGAAGGVVEVAELL